MTRRTLTTWASGLLAAGVALVSVGPAAALGAEPPSLTGPASVGAVTVTPGVGPISVSIIAPVTVATTTTTGLLSADDLENATGPFGTLTRELDAVAGSPVALGVDPMILASIRALGSSAPASAQAWLARLTNVTNEIFLLAYGDADVAAAARTSTLEALTPSGFGFALDPANFAAVDEPAADPVTGPTESATPSPTPTSTTTPGNDTENLVPSTAELLHWSSTLPAIAWPTDASIGSGDLPALGAAGFSHVIVDSSSLDAASTPLVDLDAVTGIVSDTTASMSLRQASSAATEFDRAGTFAALTASLDQLAASTPGRGVVLTLDRAGSLHGLSEALRLVQDNPNSQLVSLGTVLSSEPSRAAIVRSEPDTGRDTTFTSLVAAAAAEATFSAVVSNPAELLDPRHLQRIALYSNAWSHTDDTWARAVTAFQARSTEIVSSVTLERGSDLVLLARSTDFRVAVANALDLPVTVVVSITPQGPLLQTEGTGSVEVTVEPHATGVAKIPVEAAANGDVIVVTTVTAPDGTSIDSNFAKVNVQAEWENVGTAAIAAVLIVIVVAGFLRVLLRRRNRAAGISDDDDADAPAGAADAAEPAADDRD